MGKLVAIGVVLFVLAVGVVIVTAAPDLAALLTALRSEPLPAKIAWAVIVLVPLVMLPAIVWLSDTLTRQRKAAQALELRLDGVRQGVKEAAKSQIDADAAVHHLARTDPEDAIGAMQQRFMEAERVAQVQDKRNDIADLQSRVDDIRARQQSLKDRLAPVLDKRRTIERLFMELDTGQNDIGRALAEIVSGDDAVALDLRLKDLMEFGRQGHDRCDEIETASKTVASLKEDYAELQTRLAPFAAAKGGITQRVKELTEARNKLAAGIDSLMRTPEGALAERVQKFADDKTRLDDGVSHLNVQFSKLATLRKDIAGVAAKFEAALDILPIAGKDKADADARVTELSNLIAATQDRIEDVEHKVAVFAQLKTKLGELQTRLTPLESGEAGVVSLVGQVQDIRDRLAAKIARLEDSGDLAERVRIFTEAKHELEARVAAVTEHFSQLATVRKDLAGLFDKLSSAANASSN